MGFHVKHENESEDARFLEVLESGSQKMGIDLTGEGIKRLVIHRRVLLKWASRMNLTTVRDPEGMAELLYLDSAVMLGYLEPGTQLHDVGSGAGFPGLVIKALRPEMEVTLTEARQKKTTFLRQAARQMGLSAGLEISCRRLGHDWNPTDEEWTEVVSRAAFPVARWVELGNSLVARGGRLWIFSGQPAGDEIDEFEDELSDLVTRLPRGFKVAQRIPYHLPRTGKDRLLVSLQRD